MIIMESTRYTKAFERLKTIMDILRRDCPWDREQTFESLRYLSIEEVFELSEAVLSLDESDPATAVSLEKELGDISLHVMFYSKIAEERGMFDIADVLHAICDKLVARHPHISLPLRDGSMSEVSAQQAPPKWEQVKMKEGRKSVMEGVPDALPSMVKAVRLQEKAAGAGLDFADSAYQDMQDAYSDYVDNRDEGRFGDLLFAMVRWGAAQGINADTALCRANSRFKAAFGELERRLGEQGRSVADVPHDELGKVWKAVKQQIDKGNCEK